MADLGKHRWSPTSGRALKRYPDGSTVGVRWAGGIVETRERIYSFRLYQDGDSVRSVNCEVVEQLPDTPLANMLREVESRCRARMQNGVFPDEAVYAVHDTWGG